MKTMERAVNKTRSPKPATDQLEGCEGADFSESQRSPIKQAKD